MSCLMQTKRTRRDQIFEEGKNPLNNFIPIFTSDFIDKKYILIES